MKGNIQIFKNQVFGEVRVTEMNGEPMFCLADVCNSLGLTAKVVAQRLDDGVVSKYPIIDSLGREQNAIFVNEDGLYDAILDSRKPKAKEFRKWVTSEVLPSIRKHGAYMTSETLEKALLSPDYLIKLATILKDEKQKRIEAEQKLIEQKPSVTFACAVKTSKTSILVGELATIIKQNGVEIGEKRLYEWMRKNGYLIKCGYRKNRPTQKAMEMDLFEVSEGTVQRGSQRPIITRTTKVTGKGQMYFINKFLSVTA